MKEKKKITEHEWIFGVCFLLGVILITILSKGKTPENTLFNKSLSLTILEQGWNKKALFLQCLYSRGMIMLLLILLAYTSLRKITFRNITAWMGFSFGMLFKLFFCWYGVSGIGLLMVSVLPQVLFYWMAYGLLYWETDRSRIYTRRNYVPIILTIGVVIMGIFLESYVNPFLVNGMIKMLF